MAAISRGQLRRAEEHLEHLRERMRNKARINKDDVGNKNAADRKREASRLQREEAKEQTEATIREDILRKSRH